MDSQDLLQPLPGRAALARQLPQIIEDARAGEARVALLCLDVNGFAQVNSFLGHEVGDAVLASVAGAVEQVLRPQDRLYRTGDDEFIALLTNILHRDHAMLAAHKIWAGMEPKVVRGDQELSVRVRIGIALFPETAKSADELLRQVEIAVHRAKQEEAGYCIYEDVASKSSIATMSYERELRKAIFNGELRLHYQPKSKFETDRIYGAEALSRWHHPVHGAIRPDEFIAVAEQTGLIEDLTTWMFNAALRQCAAWREAGRSLIISVNLSTISLLDEDLPDLILRAMDTWRVEPEQLVIEITETIMMQTHGPTLGVINRLAEMGLSLSIDDFGSGYSSLVYLRQLPVDELKIEKEFVLSMMDNQSDETIVRTIIDLAHNFDLMVTAEGVETVQIYDRLKELGCDVAQGFHIGKPMSADELEQLLDAEARDQGGAA